MGRIILFFGVLTACGSTPNSAEPSDAAGSADTENEAASGDVSNPTVDGSNEASDEGTAADSAPETDAANVDGRAEAGSEDSSEAMDTGTQSDSAGACPDVLGQFGVQTSGSGCGTVFGSGSPCIRAGASTCLIVFQSSPAGGGDAGPTAINGEVQLQGDGSFVGADLTVGTIARTGCVGTWDSATSTMQVDCGGTDASQSCVLTLKRDATTCN